MLSEEQAILWLARCRTPTPNWPPGPAPLPSASQRRRHAGSASKIAISAMSAASTRPTCREIPGARSRPPFCPSCSKLFQAAANDFSGIDWRLIAAVAYHESRTGTPNATSPTNVRGIMMLTEETADRLKRQPTASMPRESILAGARYINLLKDMHCRTRYAEPDRTWLALAAYNIGPGHFNAARTTCQTTRKPTPTAWYEMKKHPAAARQAEILRAAEIRPGAWWRSGDPGREYTQPITTSWSATNRCAASRCQRAAWKARPACTGQQPRPETQALSFSSPPM